MTLKEKLKSKLHNGHRVKEWAHSTARPLASAYLYHKPKEYYHSTVRPLGEAYGRKAVKGVGRLMISKKKRQRTEVLKVKKIKVAPRFHNCAYCGRPIRGTIRKYGGQYYHPKCRKRTVREFKELSGWD
jgi:hypothetical protein